MAKIITEYLKTRKPKEFIDILQKQKVNIVFDIRFSDQYPVYYRQAELQELLILHNIDYLRFKYLGNPSWNRPPQKTDWFECKKSYYNQVLQYTLSENQIKAARLIMATKKDAVICLICYCDTLNPELCHRFWLKDVLEDFQLISKYREDL